MHVRALTDHDFSDVIVINEAALPRVAPLTILQLSDMKIQGFQCWVAEDLSGVIMGYLLGFQPIQGVDDAVGEAYIALKDCIEEPFFYIDQVAVTAAYRRHGIATMLYRKARDWTLSQQLQILACKVNVKPKNTLSLAFHHLMGFEPIKELHLSDGTAVTIMKQHLTPYDRSSQKKLTIEWKQRGRNF